MDNVITTEFNALPTKEFQPKISLANHTKIIEAFAAFRDNDDAAPVLNMSGVAIDPSSGANYLLTWQEERGSPQTILGRIDPHNAASLFFWDADSRVAGNHIERSSLPFFDGEFDWIFCDSVIEHVGGFERQYLLLRELLRVARKGVFLTTSNRKHPIEFYTALPLLHWLPTTWWRSGLKWLGKGAWASESALNLLSAIDLQRLVTLLPGKPLSSIGHVRLFGIKAHFFLQIKKQAD